MKIEPLFIQIANKKSGALDIVQSFISSSKDTESLNIARETLNNLPDISMFMKDFKEALEDLIDNGISQRFINYVNSYLKPSLCEVVDSRGNGESRYIYLKDARAPWVEAIVCYNTLIYMKAYGFSAIKKCSMCGVFFTDKGKYAKYCSDLCKSKKVV